MSCETISVRKLDYYVNNPFAQIIDVRDEREYALSHVKNAYNIPYNQLNSYLEQGGRTGNQQAWIRTVISDKSKIYIIYCDRGALSMMICNKMSKDGYITKTVVGGFSKYNGRYIVR